MTVEKTVEESGHATWMARPAGRSRDERVGSGRLQQRKPDGARRNDGAGGTGGDDRGPTWRLDLDRRAPADRRAPPLTAIFSKTPAWRVGGCNRYFGRANAVTGRMLVGPLGSTLMACEANGVMTQEQRFPRAAAGVVELLGGRRRAAARAFGAPDTLVFMAQ
jgi:hypothetical protein